MQSMKLELDLFMAPPTQTSIRDACWVKHKSINSIQNKAPIKLNMPGTVKDYINCSSILLYVPAKIMLANDNNLTEDQLPHPSISWSTASFLKLTSVCTDL